MFEERAPLTHLPTSFISKLLKTANNKVLCLTQTGGLLRFNGVMNCFTDSVRDEHLK